MIGVVLTVFTVVVSAVVMTWLFWRFPDREHQEFMAACDALDATARRARHHQVLGEIARLERELGL